MYFPPRWGKWQTWMVKRSKTHLLSHLVHSFLHFSSWLEAGLRLQLHPPSRYYGNPIWAYQDLKPKDILDNNTIAAQPAYLRDLDLRGEIWGGCRLSKSSHFLYLPHAQTQSGLIFCLKGTGTMCGIEQFHLFFVVNEWINRDRSNLQQSYVDLLVNRTWWSQNKPKKYTFRSVWNTYYIMLPLFFLPFNPCTRAVRVVTLPIKTIGPHTLLPEMYSRINLHVVLLK